MIRVQNVYYMLAYAFQVLHEQGYKNVATEEFDNVAELLSAILCRGVSVQIKRGLIRQYISREEALASPRGKLEIGESIKTQVIRKKQLVCNYDEFSVDAYPNRIIKTTMDLLLRGSISKARKKEIRKLMIFFDGISILDIHSINWDIQYDRNNQTYRMLIAVCRFVIKGLLQTTADGSTKIMDYADDQTMAKLYEKYKSGAIKSIFTQRVSFHAEKNKWESHKMSELITLQSGQDFAPTNYNEQGKGIPYMTGASCIVEGQTVVSRWTTVPRCFAYRGDTLLVCKGSGSGAVAFLSQDKVHIARQFMALRPHGGMTKEFCFYLTLHLSEKMKQSATGLIEGIDRKTVLNQRVFLPPIVEQERIVKFLSAIEKALITQEGVLKSLVSIKKGLMQQLFI